MSGARPASLLMQNRRERTGSSVWSEELDLMSRSGRRPSFPVVSSSFRKHEVGDGKKEDVTQTESIQIESTELPHSATDDLLSSENVIAPKNEHDGSQPDELSAAMSEYAAFKWRCSFDECAYQTHADGWLLTPPETLHNCALDACDSQLPVEQKNMSSPEPVSASKSSKLNVVQQTESDLPRRPVRSSSARRSSVHLTSSENSSANTKVLASSMNLASTTRRPSTPDRVPAAARPSTPDRLLAPAKPSTSDRPSTPNRLSLPARPSTPKRLSVPARPSTPNRISSTARPSTPNRVSAPARPSTPNRISAPARPSTPNRLSTPARPSTPNKLPATSRPTPDKISTPAKPSTPDRLSVPARPTTPNRLSGSAKPTTTNNVATPATSSKATLTLDRPSTPGGLAEPSIKATSFSATKHQAMPSSHPVTSSSSTTGTGCSDRASVNQTPPAKLSRPSTPSRPRTSHPDLRSSATSVSSQVSAGSSRNSTSATSNSNSRASTPTRKMAAAFSTPSKSRSISTGRFPASRTKDSAALTRACSRESPKKEFVQPALPFDFPSDIPPNLRTKMPEKLVSAAKTRPGAKPTGGVNLMSKTLQPANQNRKTGSPVTSRGRLYDNSPIPRNRAIGHSAHPTEMQKTSGPKKSSKLTVPVETNAVGRTLTRRSLDLALKKLDNRNSTGGLRSMSLFPHSIHARSSPAGSSGFLTPTSSNETDTEDTSWNDTTSGSTSVNDGFSENGDMVTSYPHGAMLVARMPEPDLYERYGYDTILLQEDSKEMNWLSDDEAKTDLLKEGINATEWLHCAGNDADDSPIFENQFEPLPEPFDLT